MMRERPKAGVTVLKAAAMRGAMGTMRQFFRMRGWLALLLLACVLFARIVIPTGFMPVSTAGGTVIQMCTGMGAVTMIVDASGKGIPAEEQKKSDSPCAFSGLGAPSLAGADAAFLAIALLFVLAIGLRPVAAPILDSVRRLRPPLRGPPLGH